MNVYADTSALVKLYVDEPGCDGIRAVETFAVSQISRVEVPAALWRKLRDPSINSFAVFDGHLRDAAVTEGFATVP